MSVTNEIIEDGNVTYQVTTDPWTTAELLAAINDAKNHLNSVNHPVHVLINLENAHHIPPNIISVIRSGGYFTHPNNGTAVFVGTSGFTRRLAETLCKIFRYEKMKFFNNEPEGRAYLKTILPHP